MRRERQREHFGCRVSCEFEVARDFVYHAIENNAKSIINHSSEVACESKGGICLVVLCFVSLTMDVMGKSNVPSHVLTTGTDGRIERGSVIDGMIHLEDVTVIDILDWTGYGSGKQRYCRMINQKAIRSVSEL